MSQHPAFDLLNENFSDFGDPKNYDRLIQTFFDKMKDNTAQIAFLWETGRFMFFSYDYFITADMQPFFDTNKLLVFFTSHIVTLKGYQLDRLAWKFSNRSVKLVHTTDPRYIVDLRDDQYVVTDISIRKEHS